jgi:hypothetical protein
MSAKRGFWNGATPPLGYKIVEAERRGQKIKLPSQGTRSRTRMFVVSYANGAPERIRTSDPQIRSLAGCADFAVQNCKLGIDGGKSNQWLSCPIANHPAAVTEEPQHHLSLYDGRELIGSIVGEGQAWCGLDPRGNVVPGSPFKSRKAAVAALNAVRPGPCAADARMDNSDISAPNGSGEAG